MSYSRSSHAITLHVPVRVGRQVVLGAFDGRAVFNRLSFDGKRFWLRGLRIQPFLLLGSSLPWVIVEDGAFFNREVGDATFFGIGADAGVGVTVYALSQLAVSVGTVYNYDFLLAARGGTGGWTPIEDLVVTNGIKIIASVTVMF